MLFWVKTIFGILFLITRVYVAYERYSCVIDGNETTVYLNLNEIAFFQTPNFPAYLNTDDFNACRLTFKLINKNITNHNLIVTLEQRSGFEIVQTVERTNDSFSYSLVNDYPDMDRISQQGYVIFVEESNYPLESSKDIYLTDETQILHLLSSFDENFKRTYPCIWRFSTSDEYGFKIVVTKFNVSSSTEFTAKNSTDAFLNKRSLILSRPYYNTDKYIQIQLSEGDPEFLAETEFEAFVSIVKKNIPKMYGNCNISTQGNTTGWSIENYQPNSYCYYNLTIFPRTEIILTGQIQIEENVDYVGYYLLGYPKIMLLPIEVNLALRTDINDSIKEIQFEFISDGSFQTSGFELIFTTLACSCADTVITCDQFLNFYIMKDTDYYCANLHCKFEINCSDPLTQFSIVFLAGTNIDQILFDDFKVYSNDEIVFEISEISNIDFQPYNIFLNSTNQNIFEVKTFDAEGPRELSFSAQGLPVQKVDRTIEISNENPTVIIDTQELISLIVVKISESLKFQNKTVMIYSNIVEDVEIYNNESLTYSMKSYICFKKPSEYSCKIKGNEFAINLKFIKNFPFLAIQLSDIYSNCIYKNNIFQTKGAEDFTITALSNSEGSCMITILISFESYYITHLWSSSQNKNVKMFIGIDQKNLFFEFNSKTATIWNKIFLLSKVYTVIMPYSTAILMRLSRFYEEIPLIIDRPFRSLLATPYYGTLQTENGNMDITYIVGNFSLKFVAINYNIANDILYFSTNGNYFYINKTGDFLIFNDQIFTMSYTSFLKHSRIYGALFYIETFEESI